MNARLGVRLREKAAALGFDALRIAPAAAPAAAGERLRQWLEAGYHGDMDWMAESAPRRADPGRLLPGARSVIMLGLNYGPDEDPLGLLADRSAGALSVYARNRDYHDVIKGKLKDLAGFLAAAARADGLEDGCEEGEQAPLLKVFVDTAPLMEKPLAQAAGLGWQGKHSNLVSREFGSWLFLGAIVTSLELHADAPEKDHCGSCRACLDACPTNAFPQPYVLDARRCVSYLTIEHKGHIDAELRAKIGNRIYGCDDCLAVCPWNKFAGQGREAKLQARADLAAPRLETLLRLDDASFRALFAGGPVKRIGHARFMRNVLIAAGNSGEPGLGEAVARHLDAPSALMRAMAVWALARIAPAALLRHRDAARPEQDEDVRREWAAAQDSLKEGLLT